jgi:hypothetical protein
MPTRFDACHFERHSLDFDVLEEKFSIYMCASGRGKNEGGSFVDEEEET